MQADRPAAGASGPLAGLRVVEFKGIGPGPFAGMLLSDMGADVVRVQRPGDADDPRDITARGRRTVTLDLKTPAGAADALALMTAAEVVIEGFRPGVMERLGLGPAEALAGNPALVYGRMTGWGQEGPLARAAGHDITYIAVTGALAAIGPAGGNPVPPLNLVGDYGGGALFLVVGVLAAVLEARRSGRGQVVDAAMCDGTAALLSMFLTLAAQGQWREERGRNLLDGGAPFYTTYECADGRHIAVGPLEPQFFAELCVRTGISGPEADGRDDPASWPALAERLRALFLSRSRDEWCALLEGTDACVAPVLTMGEAPSHPHLAARGTFTRVGGMVQPAPAPRFSRTPSAVQGPPAAAPMAAADILAGWRAE